MLYILDTPPDEVFARLSERYPQMDVLAVKACLSLTRCGIEMLTSFELFLERFNLSHGRFLVLASMNRYPEDSFTPTQLAESLNVSRATMTGLLDGLESAGLVERGIHPQDRRKMSVNMTDKGRGTIDEIMPELYTTMAQVMDHLSESEKQSLTDTLAKVVAALDQVEIQDSKADN